MDINFILQRIPHRPPFLWLDKVIEIDDNNVTAEKTIPADLDFLKGHYPDYPIMPGVILCEAVFQAGALLIAENLYRQQQNNADASLPGVPVLTRILGAKFKREVKPGQTIILSANIREKVGPAWFLKGKVTVAGKTAVKVDFACAISEKK